MAYDNLPPSKPAPRRSKGAPVFCVGWRAFVHWPNGAKTAKSLPLVDATGQPLANDLADGQQVEILSWRPRSRDGLLYQIRRLTDGSEWWIEARFLRREATAQPERELPASGALR
jgi:hypothetical protein